MKKLTMTEFKALAVEQQYSAYDDAMNFGDNHQMANEDFAVRVAAYDAEKADLVTTTTDKQKEADDLKAERDAALGNVDAANAQTAAANAEIDKAQVIVDNLSMQLQEAQALIVAMGGTELGQQLAKEKKLAELTAAKTAKIAEQAAIEAELAKLA